MAENIPPTPSAFEYQSEGQNRSYASTSKSEIGPGLFLGNTEMVETYPMSGIEPDFSLGNAKKADIHPAPCARARILQKNSKSILSLPAKPAKVRISS